MNICITDLMDDCCPEQVVVTCACDSAAIRKKVLARISSESKATSHLLPRLFLIAAILASLLMGSIASAHFSEDIDLSKFYLAYNRYVESNFTPAERNRLLVECLVKNLEHSQSKGDIKP